MSTINISLPDSMKEFVNKRMTEGHYSTVSEYVRQLIRQEQEREVDRQLAEKLLEGDNSGPPIKGNAAYWEKKKAALAAKITKNLRR